MMTWSANPQHMARVQQMLHHAPEAAKTATMRAINKTLTGVITDATKEVRNVYNIKASRVKRNFQTVRATKERLSGKFVSKGDPITLMQFSAKQNARGVSVKIMKSGARKTIKHAFIAEGKNNNTLVFHRLQDASGNMVRRMPIWAMTGPRIEDALAKPAVQSRLATKMDDRLKTNCEHEADYMLSQL